MAALTADRYTVQVADTESRNYPMAASTKIYGGSLVGLDASGNANDGAATATLNIVGVAMEQIDNSSGSAGDLKVEVRAGMFWFANNGTSCAAGDEGKLCYVVDDQSVDLSSSSGARPVAGHIVQVDATLGVLVEVGRNAVRGSYVTAQVRLADISTASTAWVCPGVAGEVVRISSVIDGAIATADATLTPDIGTTPITGGAITVATAGSAAGTTDAAEPTAANVITATDALSVATDGASTNTVPVVVTFLIRLN